MRALRSRLLKVVLLAWLLLLLQSAGCATEISSGMGAPGAASEGDSKPAESAKPAGSATPEQEDGPRPEDALKSSADLVTRVRAAVRDFKSISARATLSSRVAVATDGIRRSRRAAWVRDIRYSFAEDKQQIDALQAQVDEVSVAMASDRKRTDQLLAFWQRVKVLAV